MSTPQTTPDAPTDAPIVTSTDPSDPSDPSVEETPSPGKRPLYPRLLRLQHVHPNAWQRAVLGEGAFGVAALLCLADVASLWTLLVLPVAVAGVVKAHDVLAGFLASSKAPGGAGTAHRAPVLNASDQTASADSTA